MFAVSSYNDIVARENSMKEQGSHIVILLFVRPGVYGTEEIISQFSYLHYNSDKYCNIYAPGYTNDFSAEESKEYRKIGICNNDEWYYSDKNFVDFKNKLERRLQWQYSGENDLLILQNDVNSNNILSFKPYVALNLNYGVRNGYIKSFNTFAELLIRQSKSEAISDKAFKKTQFHKYNINTIVSEGIKQCKRIPKPIKEVLNDGFFYLNCRKMSKD